ncbi:uncharacterized protein LOC114517547 [Dendronephthya gigantea]|uniref:uncharacterized protein LOC114517547 n=1 Tax=Dendronephthya gigantea TaxID=151771 RepID=UPI00106909C4|nr:uncharacterized protein LOC114517547 [Dendronephthya gigantea]
MTNLHHSTSMLDHSTTELPMRITNSFPPRGIVAKVLNNSQNTKGKSLYLYGHFKEHSTPNITKTKIKNTEDTHRSAFSLPQTMTERTFKTRKTPRFYTVDTSSLRRHSSKVDHALDRLITKSDVTGLQEIYDRTCKGSISTLQTLISKRKLTQKFVFVQNAAPLPRYHQNHKTARPEQKPHKEVTVEESEINVDKQLGTRETTEALDTKTNKHVLLPSPYFNRKNEENTTSLSKESSQHIYSSSYGKNSGAKHASKCSIEPTVINLNYKLPELQRRAFSAKNAAINIENSSKKNSETHRTLQKSKKTSKDLKLWTRGNHYSPDRTIAKKDE